MRTLLVVSLLTLAGCSAHLPDVAPQAFRPPSVTLPPTSLEVCWLETAGTETWGGFGSAGMSSGTPWEATASSILVRHPKGDLLIDSGNPPQLEEELREVSLLGKVVTRNLFGRFERRGDLVALLREAGADPRHLKGAVLSHVHGDHAGGMSALPGVPVLLPKEELDFTRRQVEAHGWRVLPAHGRVIARQGVELKFGSGPYANFDRSHDVYGDGTVVVVPLFGHTPGSVGVFVNLSPSRRLLHVGDTVNTRESLDRGVNKSWVMRTLTDDDGDLAAAQVARLIELRRADPALQMVPAHDRRAWTAFFGEMPRGRALRCVGRPS